jgi:hypothetical protein
MNLTHAQAVAAKRLTTTAERFNTFESGEAINGSIAWELHDWSGVPALVGSNLENAKWFETRILIIAVIGPRGGITIQTAEGIAAKYLN